MRNTLSDRTERLSSQEHPAQEGWVDLLFSSMENVRDFATNIFSCVS